MKKASIRKSALKIVAVLVVLVAVATAAFFRSKPMLDPADSPRISLITADYENGGESYRSMEQTDISQNLNNQLIALFQGTQMRNVRFLRPQSFRMEPDSVYLNVWVETDRVSMLVNLSTNSDYNSRNPWLQLHRATRRRFERSTALTSSGIDSTNRRW